MPGSRWKNALANLLDVVALRRFTSRVALSAGLLGLAMQSTPDAAAQPRVPTMPTFNPEATVRKFKGRYVLRRTATSYFMHLTGHSSHSSHSSHASHASHSSSSHYSGSHFSSSPSPSPSPVPPTVIDPIMPEPQPEPVPVPVPRAKPQPKPKPKPLPLLREDFSTDTPLASRWTVGVLATPPSTFDETARISQREGTLHVAPVTGKSGVHFSGYVSVESFDLGSATIATEVKHAAAGVTIFAAAIDDANWAGFRIEGGQLSMESHSGGKVAVRKIAYDSAQHRFLRLRTSSVAAVIVWETSPDGTTWNPEYVETASIKLTPLRIALSAGSTRAISTSSAAQFDNVTVETRR